jgi:peroxiredoxin
MAPDTKEPATGFRCCSGPPDPAPPPIKPGHDVGETVASFEVPLLDGGAFESRKLAGRPTVMTFWASWCGPCQKEMPALAKVYEGYRKEGLDVVGISVDTDETKLRTWLEKNPMPFRIARDPGGKLMDTFTDRGLPTTFWIKKDGTIRLRTTGLPPGADKRLNELAAELVGVEPRPEVIADAKPPPKQ